MALDGIFLCTLLDDLKKQLIGCKIDKVNQPEKDEIILTIRGNKSSKLLLSASSNFPRIHFTKQNKDNPLQAPIFCMVLRKYLCGGRILDIKQYKGDRIVIIDVETTDELGFNSVYSLIVEIMGRHSNITLVRSRDNKIMECIKHITPDINSFRTLLPGLNYVYPPDSNKLNPWDLTNTLVEEKLEEFSPSLNESTFLKLFTGVSKAISKDLYKYYSEKYGDELIASNIYNTITSFTSTLLSNKTYSLYRSDNNVMVDFYCVELSDYNGKYEVIHYNDPSEMLDNFYSLKDKQDRLQSRSIDLQRFINTNIDRCKKKEAILFSTLEECKEKEDFKVKGDLLTSFIYEIRKGMEEISVLNFYSEEESYLTIKLDENKTPSENVQYYYKKYNKLKKSEESAILQLEKNSEELDYLNSVLTNIQNIEFYNELDDIRNELIEAGYIRFNKKTKKKIKPSKPMHFVSSDGIDIYVGKNNIQNDFITTKLGEKTDTWLHAKNIPGSHVLIKALNIPDTTLEEAANLAAYFSKGKESTKVPVDYTQIKNVKKPSGSKPGMVIYYTNKTIYIDPVEPTLKRVQ